ncbi:hypothetical protein L1F30_13900 [Simiduia sp. 21SJ11W-1]|uniref:hypothetical protein n=1 Tax=Simiduia sp. 21SJ11W-1 TaxID=2909669 RepID=UPI00209E3934|nr:hypothetical protein [Simiduia sp. 21SJ11W-1]UTA47250.1 hypothetical protein L1F30_13900 [Simiduia sp. 21SJ11W-1]
MVGVFIVLCLWRGGQLVVDAGCRAKWLGEGRRAGEWGKPAAKRLSDVRLAGAGNRVVPITTGGELAIRAPSLGSL